MRQKEIPQEVKDVLTTAAKKYSETKATTNAGRILRFIAAVVPVETVIKIFAHKLSK